jgi:hypothetical protein
MLRALCPSENHSTKSQQNTFSELRHKTFQRKIPVLSGSETVDGFQHPAAGTLTSFLALSVSQAAVSTFFLTAPIPIRSLHQTRCASKEALTVRRLLSPSTAILEQSFSRIQLLHARKDSLRQILTLLVKDSERQNNDGKNAKGEKTHWQLLKDRQRGQ